MRVRNGWRICRKMCVSVFVCATWLRRITASFLSTFIAKMSVVPFLRTSITFPKPPLPSTLSRSKSSRHTDPPTSLGMLMFASSSAPGASGKGGGGVTPTSLKWPLLCFPLLLGLLALEPDCAFFLKKSVNPILHQAPADQMRTRGLPSRVKSEQESPPWLSSLLVNYKTLALDSRG